MIRIIVTGGTIDKEYNPIKGELDFPTKHMEMMLKQANCTLTHIVEDDMLKDSLEMTDEDRQTILESCMESFENNIIISHGTDTMVETAKKIAHHIKNKTIVLFGAMIPYRVSGSDALFNLGFALSAVQTLQNGVYIAMNGKIHTWNKVIKNKSKGVFERKK